MDSLKIPKGGSGKLPSGTGSVPLAIRFNASEESVEDVLVPPSGGGSADGGDSLSSSPQQSSEDFSWRKDFLQGSFFTRKRSGSIEGAPSPASSLISNLSSSDTNTIGTWKLIKGKVSQAMGDIKSSKSGMSSVQPNKGDGGSGFSTGINDDSDVDTATINSSMSDELSLDLAVPVSRKHPKSEKQIDSDSDIDDDILDIEPTTTLHKSLVNLRSKTPATKPENSVASTKRTNPLGAPPPPSIVPKTTGDIPTRSGFLRKRKKVKDQVGAPVARKKDVEIESGVEMMEDMILPAAAAAASITTASNNNETFVSFRNAGSSEKQDDTISSSSPTIFCTASFSIGNPDLNFSLKAGSSSSDGPDFNSAANFSPARPALVDALSRMFRTMIATVYKSRSLLIALFLLAMIVVLPLPDFFRGVIACLFTISTVSTIGEFVGPMLERIQRLWGGADGGGPEKSPFKIPDYSAMPICQIPAAEEHKSLKSYAGWMNEINNYDPTNYHISMTRPVFVRLDGSILRISNTTTRVPKRSMWNEQLIDKNSATFTRNRCFNLLGCRVAMCPKGLARKRHFSRKYPIQLIIKTSEEIKSDEDVVVNTKRHSTPTTVDKDTVGTSSATSNLTAALASFGTGTATAAPDSVSGSVCAVASTIEHQNSNESHDDRSDQQNDLDFGSAILQSNLQRLQDNQETTTRGESVPCGDETRLLLFARCDREKEDWYRRFGAASIGEINDQELHIPDIVMMTDDEIASAIKAVPTPPQLSSSIDSVEDPEDANDPKKRPDKRAEEDTIFEGLLMTTDAARNPPDYIKFMSRYQKACRTQIQIPIIKSPDQKRYRRQKKQEDELWKGIDQTMYLGPSGSVVWANILIGRVLFSCLNDSILLEKIQEFLQKKLSAIKLPSFMEDVVIAQTHMGDTPPLIHRVSQPVLDERGTWIDADVTYEGLMHMTITTKLNLLRLKRQHQHHHHHGQDGSNGGQTSAAPTASAGTTATYPSAESPVPTESETAVGSASTSNCAIYDSNAESSGASSSESDSPTMGTVDPSVESSSQNSSPQTFYNAPGSSRRLFRIVDRITASNLFQSATEISYIQRAMENMSTKITLRVELKGLVARVVLNFPPPPSDRIWIAFRGPPRLWISAKPAVGDHTFDWSIVTNVIESKLCEEVYKYLVYPNMVDIIAPFLGQSTYKE